MSGDTKRTAQLLEDLILDARIIDRADEREAVEHARRAAAVAREALEQEEAAHARTRVVSDARMEVMSEALRQLGERALLADRRRANDEIQRRMQRRLKGQPA